MKTPAQRKCAPTRERKGQGSKGPRSQKGKGKDRKESEVRKESQKSIEKTANAFEIEG